MKRNIKFQSILYAILVIVAATPALGDDETVFMNNLLKVSWTVEQAMSHLAVAYTTKCGTVPSVAQMRLIAETDPAYGGAVAMLTVRADQLGRDVPVASNPPFNFTQYMQTVAGVICR